MAADIDNAADAVVLAIVSDVVDKAFPEDLVGGLELRILVRAEKVVAQHDEKQSGSSARKQIEPLKGSFGAYSSSLGNRPPSGRCRNA